MNFSDALDHIKNGEMLEREGWNGKGMNIHLVEGRGDRTAYLEIESVNGTFTPWLASQTDLLAEDWQVA